MPAPRGGRVLIFRGPAHGDRHPLWLGTAARRGGGAVDGSEGNLEFRAAPRGRGRRRLQYASVNRRRKYVHERRQPFVRTRAITGAACKNNECNGLSVARGGRASALLTGAMCEGSRQYGVLLLLASEAVDFLLTAQGGGMPAMCGGRISGARAAG